MSRAHNFGAGPAQLPLPVLEKAQSELLDFKASGMSIMEMSHRSKTYDEVHQAAIDNVRRLMNVPEDYEVLFLPGGASQQFALIPLNLMLPGRTADYINTGSWAGKALKEAQICVKAAGEADGRRVNVPWDGADGNYSRMPNADELQLTPDAAYLHICSNETIQGILFIYCLCTDAPIIADMSSEIMSRVINVADFGMIYAGAQKNLGPSGLALAIIRRDLLDRCPETVNVYLRYRTHAKEASLYNTPNTWAIYLLRLVTDWLIEQGGITAMEERNERKAALLYDAIDSSDFWRGHAQKPYRSTMNVSWRLPCEELEAQFVKEATAAGLIGLKGLRTNGDMRAIIYNACPVESVQALVDFMKEFERRNG